MEQYLVLITKTIIMKKSPKANLENYKKLFFQLGLVFTLFVVYLLMDYKDYQEVDDLGPAIVESTLLPDEPIFQIEKIEPEPVKQKPVTAEIVKKVEDDAPIEESIIDPEPDPDELIDLSAIETYEEPDEDIVEDVSFIIIENAPVFPGCKGSEAKIKACFTKKIQKHVSRKFNSSLAGDLGLTPGKKRISVLFVIDADGNIINVQARAPHKRLEKEAIRVIELLPQMKPGRQRNKPVKVKYSLPIIFNVE